MVEKRYAGKINLPAQEIFYFDEEEQKFVALVSNGAIPVTVVGGEAGGGSGSMRFLNGVGVPSEEDGLQGDLYLATDSGMLYKKASTWLEVVKLKGAKGDTGATGKAGTNGAKGDTGATGKAGFGTSVQYDAIIARLDALESP